MKWFSSDPHFGHQRIIELCNRPFRDVDQMNWRIINNFNSVINRDDVLILCGDIALGQIDQSLPLLNFLNGHKILIPGNHDRISSVSSMDKYRERFKAEYAKYFDEIWPEVAYSAVGPPEDRREIVLSHYPYQGDHTENDRHVEQRPKDEGLPLVHGHIHELRKFEGRMFNVGVDVNNFMPVSEEEVYAWIKGLD